MKFAFRLVLAIAVFVSPAFAGVTVVGNLARHTVVKPGATFDGVIFLKNTDTHSAEVRIYQTDYLCQADGTNEYGSPGSHARSNANWISVTPVRVIVEGGATVPVRYKGRAPGDPHLQGTYWSMVMIEPSAPSAPNPSGASDKVSMGLQTQIRFGVQIVTEIGSTGIRRLQVNGKAISKVDGRRIFNLDLGNDGERLLIPAMNVELFDQTGASIGRFEGGRSRIYPTCSIRTKVDLTDVPSGKYVAMVMLDSGDDQVMAAQYDLTLDP